MTEQSEIFSIGDTIKHRTSRGGYRKATITGIVESFFATPDYLVENLDGTVEQLHWKECKPVEL